MADDTGGGMSRRLRSVWDEFRTRREEAAQRPGGTFGPMGDVPDVPERQYTDDELGRGAYEPYVAPAMRLAAAWSWRSVAVLIGIGAGLWLLSQISVIVLPALIALLISALLAPMSAFLIRHGWPRGLAAGTVFIGFIVLVAGLLALTGQQIVAGFSELATQVVAGFRAISDWLQHNPFGIDSTLISDAIDDGLNQALGLVQTYSGEIVGGAVGAAASVGSLLTGLILTLFTAFFFLYDGRTIFSWFVGLLPVPARPKVEGAAVRGWQTLVQYVRVQIIVAAVDAVGIGIVAAILGIPLVVPLTVLVFLGSFIPIVGAVLTGAIAVIVALVSQGFVSALIMLGGVLIVQQLEGNVLQPFIMGKAVSVHPLAVVLAVSAGGFLFGIAGALFAVPVIAVANTVVLFMVGRDVLAENAAQAEAANRRRKKKRGKGGSAHDADAGTGDAETGTRAGSDQGTDADEGAAGGLKPAEPGAAAADATDGPEAPTRGAEARDADHRTD